MDTVFLMGRRTEYRVDTDRVPGVLFSRPQASVPPPLGSRGGTHSLLGEWAGGANSDEGTGTLVL